MIPYIDKAFAAHFLGENGPEDATAFLCYLLASMRSGHLCIRFEEGILTPHPREIWKEPPPELVPLIISGIKNLPPLKILHIENNHYYLKKNWVFETKLLELLHKLLKEQPDKKVSFESNPALTEEQLNAIHTGCQNCFTIITGGPGTGKTYTAGHLLNQLQKAGLEIVIAAPTGKAAARLQQSLPLKAKTLHSLLEVHKEEEVRLSADVVLVDECSMIDIKMMVRLFSALKKGARLILLGDPYQLPPVETGNIFADMVDYLAASAHLARLTLCLRAENQPLIHFAKLVNEGECQAALHYIENAQPEISYTRTSSMAELFAEMEEELNRIEGLDEEQAALQFERFRVLSPLRKGPFGVEEVNQWFEKRRNSPRYVPIILTKHAKDYDLYNGDTGIVAGEYALFKTRKIPIRLLPEYELAYCLSVHKSQGSEYEHVYILLPEGSEHFGRQALYTAITRAKRRITLWEGQPLLEQIIRNRTQRVSGLKSRL